MDKQWQEKVLIEYCGNEMTKLKQLCFPKISKIGGIYQMDYDDLYSIALDVLRDSVEKYDGVPENFEMYLRGNINRKFSTYIRDRNTIKKTGEKIYNKDGERVFLQNVSLDEKSDDGISLADKIASDFSMESAIESIKTDGRADIYMSNLSETQKKIANMIISGETDFGYIRDTIGLSEKEFNVAIKQMRDYKNARLLHRKSGKTGSIKEDHKMEITKSAENAKNTSYSISSILRQMKDYELRDDHVLQRESEQWAVLAKSELISDILQGNSVTPIIISEEIKNGIAMHWLIDGKQRCTNIEHFVNNGYAVSKNVTVYMIRYQTKKRDENGKIVRNSDGFPVYEVAEFDIRGKKFKKFPEELQNRFLDYQIPVMLNLNCDKYKIAYDIARFNRCKPMNKSQDGWTGMEESFAELVDNILKMPMFKPDCHFTSYTDSNNKTGDMRRMIVESIMLSDYADGFKKDFRSMCKYLSDNANDATFAKFYSQVDRLSNILFDEMAAYFNKKDSFVWFALFSKFCETGKDDKHFVEFLTDFLQSVHKDEYDKLSTEKHSKSKADVMARLEYLENCMNEYLSTIKDITLDADTNKFVEDLGETDLMYETNLSKQDIQDVAIDILNNVENTEDALFYANCANDWLLNIENRQLAINKYVLPAVVMLVKYVYDLEKSDEYGIDALGKFLNSGLSGNDVQQNYAKMLACAA